MAPLDLPEPIAAYFDADTQDAAAVARCFTPDARVRDEGDMHVGRAAIEAWKAASSTRYSYRATPLALDRKDRDVTVTARVTGNFPGSPVELRYVFKLERGQIASLEIAP